MSIFIKNVIEGKTPKVFGGGSQTRCFTYVDDAVEGILSVLEKGKAGEAYNIGNDKETTILELAKLTIKVSGKSLKPEIVPFSEKTRLKEREINYRQPDNSKMKKIGWKPKVLVEEGLQRTYEWMEKNHD
jgi:nucleoside-diphosphate-sugar epimerase